jgi:hypothetical protein
MPNLNTAAAQDWLRALQPGQVAPDWPPPIRPIEELPGHPAALAALGHDLDELTDRDAAALHHVLTEAETERELRDFLCQLGAARLLRLIHWLTSYDRPGAVPIHAILVRGETPEALALRSAVKTLSRRLTLQRIFSADRLAALQAACSDTSKEAA